MTNKTCITNDLKSLIASGKKFGCIYIDPPWQYDNRDTRGAAEDHYPTMTMEQINALPIGDLAADKSHLHLWTTNAFLHDALHLIDNWGFVFKGSFIWAKPQIGMGNYWRVSHEYLLLGVRGSCVFRDKTLKSWQLLPRKRHSAKPYRVKWFIERASPGPYLELFGRKLVAEWTVLGNQVNELPADKTIFPQEHKRRSHD